MKRTQFEPLVIHDYEESVFHLPAHSHTYYEMIYIVTGKGVHRINSNLLPYQEGDLFLISPEDEHHFEIVEPTHFTFIKFTDSYFSRKNHLAPDAFLTTSPEEMMRNKLLKEVKLVMNEPCTSILRNTIANLVAYNCRKDIATSPLVYYQLLSVFGLVKEAAAKLKVRIDNGQPDKEELISYIHQHVYEPQLIQIKNIAAYFNIGLNYFSNYFRNNFEMSYRDYVNTYKTQLIEKRILSGAVTMKEIAGEFGFTDESHLSNFFKSRKNISPGAYRKLSAK